MIEIILLFLAVRAFMRKAESKGLDKKRWGLYGALSYLLPVIFSSFLILPVLMNMRIIPSEGFSFLLIAMSLNLILGITCCFALYQYLKRMDDPIKEKPQILDHFR